MSDPTDQDLVAEVLLALVPNTGCLFSWERHDRQDPLKTPGALWHPVHSCNIHRGHGGKHQCECEAVADADAQQDPTIPRCCSVLAAAEPGPAYGE